MGKKMVWQNPYHSLQGRLRSLLRQELGRHNGRITEEAFNAAFGVKNFDKLKDRLFIKHDGVFEWKPEIVSFTDLERKVAINLGKEGPNVKELFKSSKMLAKRTRHPFITTANKKNQIKPSTGFGSPVYGFDILIRPSVEFSDNSSYREESPTLHIGTHSFAVAIHIALDGEDCVIDAVNRYLFRVVWGSYFKDKPECNAIRETFQAVEYKALTYLKEKDYPTLISYLAKKANKAVENTLSLAAI